MRLPAVEGVLQLPLRRVRYAILAGLLISVLLRHVARPAGNTVWLSALLFVPMAGFIAGYSSSVDASATVAIQFALLCAAAPAVFKYHIDNTKNFVPCVAIAFLSSQIASSIAGLLQLTGYAPLGQQAVFGRSTGLAGHPNALGIMAAVAVLLSIVLLTRVTTAKRVVLWSSIVVNASAVVATGSLSAMLAAAVGAAVLVIGHRKILAALVVSSVIVGTFLLTDGTDFWAVSFIQDRISVVTGEATSGGAASLDVRVQTYNFALNYLQTDPIFGVGLDDQNSGTFNGVTEVHNVWLHAWYQGGLLLLVWFLAVTVMLVVAVVAALKSRAGLGSAAVIATILTFAATSNFFLQEQYWIPLLFAVAAIPTTTPFRRQSAPTHNSEDALTESKKAGRVA